MQAAADCMTQDAAPTCQDVTSMAEKQLTLQTTEILTDENAAAYMPGPSKPL